MSHPTFRMTMLPPRSDSVNNISQKHPHNNHAHSKSSPPQQQPHTNAISYLSHSSSTTSQPRSHIATHKNTSTSAAHRMLILHFFVFFCFSAPLESPKIPLMAQWRGNRSNQCETFFFPVFEFSVSVSHIVYFIVEIRFL